jgi:hypothetical protein
LDSLKNVEQDEAGRLRAFRDRFGRGWDLDSGVEADGPGKADKADNGGVVEDSLLDLISGSADFTTLAKVSEKKTPVQQKEQKMVRVKVDGVLKTVPATNPNYKG